MYQTYAAVGSVLLTLGIVYTYLFIRLLVGNNKESHRNILALSEAIGTVFIGIFFLYSAIMLVTNGEKVDKTTNFINTIDSIIVRNNTDSTYQMVNKHDILATQTEVASNIEEVTEKHVIELPDDVTNYVSSMQTESTSNTDVTTDTFFIDEKPENVSETVTEQPAKEILAEPNKADQFLQKYQSFIKEMMKDKLKNVSFSVSNQTYHNVKNPTKQRDKRDVKLKEEKKPNCYYEFFIHNALLIYSFVHCLITIVNNTLQCKSCIKIHGDSQDKTETSSSQKDWSNDSSMDSNSEKNYVSAPVGPLFELEINEPTDIPNLKLFEARIKETTLKSQSIQVEQDQMQIKAEIVPPQIRLALQVILTYLLPVMGIVVLYSITNQESLEQTNLDMKFLNDQNFSSTQADINILNRIQAPSNITNTESLEVDKVIKNVYNIVNQVRENSTKKTTYFSPMMVETLYFMKPSLRNPKVTMEKCPKIDQSIKTYYFFIFIAAYFAAILYAKIIHIDAKSKKVDSAKEQNISLLTFSALWLPSVLDIFFRMFVTQEKATVFSDLFLALGNTNRIYTMASNHIQCKKSVSKPNFIEPETL